MAVYLASRECVFGPLLSKPRFLRAFADGAVPLIAVFPVKLMTVLAMTLSRVLGGEGFAVLKHVLRFSQKRKVFWIYAGSVAARVIDDHAFWDRTVLSEPCKAMGSAVLSGKPKSAIPILIEGTFPFVTSIKSEMDLGEESKLVFLFNHTESPYAPNGIMARKVKSNGMV